MKNIRFIRTAVVVALLFISFAATAREWHVNNKQGIPAHFSDINAAMASADVVDGDTLYIGNGAVLGAQTISKAVTVIGTGWNFIDSPITRAAINGDITISANGAKVQGLYINGRIKPVIERCRFNGILENSKQINVLKLYSNYITGNITGSRRSGYYEYGYDDISIIYNKNWEIAGNIITGEIITLNMATIANNVLVSSISSILRRNHYILVANNIIICTADKNAIQYINHNSIFKNNVLSTSNEFDGNITLGSNDLALGNALGSNIFNITLVLGLCNVISPMHIPLISPTDWAFLIGSNVVLAVCAFTRMRLCRLEGFVLLLCYAAYGRALYVEEILVAHVVVSRRGIYACEYC